MEIFFGYQFQEFVERQSRLNEGLLLRAIQHGIITDIGANYLREVNNA